MEFGLLGGLVVRDGDRAVDLGGPKQRAVLAALLLDCGRTVASDRLIDQVWGDDPPPRAESSLQAYVSNLRKVLEPGRRPREEPTLLVTRPNGYAVLADRSAVDVLRFEDAAADGHRRLADGTLAEAAAALDRALSLWTGPLLPELHDEPWVVGTGTRLARTRAQAVEDRVDAGLALGEHAAMVPLLEAGIADEPYRERFRAQLALALYRCGRQREALAALTEARRVLVEEVGIDPGRDLRELEQAILDQDADLDWSPPTEEAAPGTDAAAPVPAAVARRPGRPFVGRDRELALLADALSEVRSGNGRPVVISGEPGIGKTRLVEELTALADGAAVAWARCPESAAQAAYWPCLQIGRQLEAAGAVEHDLVSTLLPDDDVLDGDPVADRLSFHVAVAKVLASSTVPLVVVIDDLQWADPASLRVLEFIAGELRHTKTLLLATVRPLGPDASAPLLDCLAEMARQPGAARLDLSGLTQVDVGHWLELRGSGPADPAVAGLLHDRTGGNAFFVGEVVELLAAEGRLTDVDAVGRASAVPAAVQDVIRRRVGRLPGPTQQLLSTASVVGRTFDLDVVAAVGELDPGEVLDRLEPALDSGLVVDTDQPGRFQFVHALVADTLLAELSAVRRARAHATVATTLIRLRSGDLDDEVAAIAHHSFQGAGAGTAELAHEWSVRAARLATSRLAHEDAAEHWARAATAIGTARPADTATRYDDLLESGLSLLRVDTVGAAYERLAVAIDLAVAMGDVERVGRAAAAMNVEGLWLAGEIALTSVDAAGALQRAIAILPDAPTTTMALALGALAENAYWFLPAEDVDAITEEAVAVARAAGDPTVLARTLHKRNQALWRASGLAPRKAAAEELLAMIDEQPFPLDLQAVALFGAASVSWEEGDTALTRQRVARARAIAARTGTPALVTQLDFCEAGLLTTAGELAAADALLDRAYELYRRTRRWAAESFRAAYKSIVWMEQGRLDDVVEVAPTILEDEYAPFFGEGLALAYTELGALDRAAAIARELPPLVDSWLFLGVAGAAAQVRVALGDADSARVLRDHLRPYAGRLAVPGTGPALGDIDLALGRIEHLLGDDEAALAHLDASIRLLTRANAVPWLVRAWLARHDVTGDPADLERAAEAVATRDLPLLRRRVQERQGASK